MTPDQVQLVQSTWQKVLPIADQATRLFYDRLFELAPGVRSLFPTDIGPQRMKLGAMLNAAVNGLTDVPKLVIVLQALGRRHVAYGAKAEHYPVVGSALLWTLEQGLGPAFTPAVQNAWAAAYGVISATMIEASTAHSVAADSASG